MAFKLGFKTCTIPEIVVISDFIVKNYSDFSMMEIFDSFDLGISGKLGIKTEDIKHYQSFNIIYIGIFLNAYRPYREKIMKENAIKPEAPKPLPPEESLKIANESAKLRLLEAYKVLIETNEYKLIDNGNIIYGYLDSLGLIGFDTTKKKRIYEQAKNQHLNKMMASDPRKYKNVIQNVLNGLDTETVKSDAKRLALKIWMNEQVEMGQDLETLINETKI